MKQLIRKLLGRQKLTSEDLLEPLRQRGAIIGKDIYLYSPADTVIDGTCPCLLTIGEHVRIAKGVRILTHDYSWSVLKHYSDEDIQPGAVLGAQGPVEIGNRVFIGMNAIITRNVRIGDHVIIGAGSVVTRDCESGGVYAGNPARRIMSISEFFEKRNACQLQEAKTLALAYRDRLGKLPPQELFTEYFMLFSTAEEAEKISAFRRQMELLGNFSDTVRYMQDHPPKFQSYEAFLEYCFEKEEFD